MHDCDAFWHHQAVMHDFAVLARKLVYGIDGASDPVAPEEVVLKQRHAERMMDALTCHKFPEKQKRNIVIPLAVLKHEKPHNYCKNYNP